MLFPIIRVLEYRIEKSLLVSPLYSEEMKVVNVLVVGTGQSGKTSLVANWTGLRGTPVGQRTTQIFVATVRWDRMYHIRDTPALEMVDMATVFSDDYQPDIIVVLGTTATSSLLTSVNYGLQHTTVPILIVVNENEELSPSDKVLTEAISTRRVEVWNGVIVEAENIKNWVMSRIKQIVPA